MKQTKIEVQITKNLGNYESVRIGGEWSVDKTDNQQAAYAAAIEELNAIYAANYLRQPATAEATPEPATVAEDKTATVANSKQPVSFKDNPELVTKICDRITKGGVTREVIDLYYDLDEQASNVINLALKLAKKVVK